MTTTFARRLASVAAVSTLFLSGLAAAQATGGPSGAETNPPQSKKPPEQQAIDACKDHKEGDRVTFKSANGKTRKYACSMVDGVLAARSGVATAAKKTKAEKAAQ